MKKSYLKKKKIFDIYSRNLSWLKENPKIRFEPDFVEGYICPLCFDIFSVDSLSDHSENPLTLDHNPPKSLGGKSLILTCKSCNSISGHQIDNHLLKRLNEYDFANFKPNTKRTVTLVHDEFKLSADFGVNENKEIIIGIDKFRSNPRDASAFFGKLSEATSKGPIASFLHKDSLDVKEFKFNMRVKFDAKGDHAEIGLLKIAYLYAFQVLGNSFLLNPYLGLIRKQIQTPNENIINGPVGIEFSGTEKPVGLCIISDPPELKCFFVGLELYTKNSKFYYAVILPGLSNPGIDIYKNIDKLGKDDSKAMFKVEVISVYDYVNTKELTFATQHLWKTLTGS